MAKLGSVSQMPLPHRLSENLRRALGDQAAEDMLSWMEDVESRRSEMAQLRESIRADFAEFRETMRGDFAELRQQMRDGEARLREEDVAIRAEIKQAKYDLIKWSFVFRVTAVASITGLAKVLR